VFTSVVEFVATGRVRRGVPDAVRREHRTIAHGRLRTRRSTGRGRRATQERTDESSNTLPDRRHATGEPQHPFRRHCTLIHVVGRRGVTPHNPFRLHIGNGRTVMNRHGVYVAAEAHCCPITSSEEGRGTVRARTLCAAGARVSGARAPKLRNDATGKTFDARRARHAGSPEGRVHTHRTRRHTMCPFIAAPFWPRVPPAADAETTMPALVTNDGGGECPQPPALNHHPHRRALTALRRCRHSISRLQYPGIYAHSLSVLKHGGVEANPGWTMKSPTPSCPEDDRGGHLHHGGREDAKNATAWAPSA
jgi:hypothetical protein